MAIVYYGPDRPPHLLPNRAFMVRSPQKPLQSGGAWQPAAEHRDRPARSTISTGHDFILSRDVRLKVLNDEMGLTRNQRLADRLSPIASPP